MLKPFFRLFEEDQGTPDGGGSNASLLLSQLAQREGTSLEAAAELPEDDPAPEPAAEEPVVETPDSPEDSPEQSEQSQPAEAEQSEEDVPEESPAPSDDSADRVALGVQQGMQQFLQERLAQQAQQAELSPEQVNEMFGVRNVTDEEASVILGLDAEEAATTEGQRRVGLLREVLDGKVKQAVATGNQLYQAQLQQFQQQVQPAVQLSEKQVETTYVDAIAREAPALAKHRNLVSKSYHRLKTAWAAGQLPNIKTDKDAIAAIVADVTGTIKDVQPDFDPSKAPPAKKQSRPKIAEASTGNQGGSGGSDSTAPKVNSPGLAAVLNSKKLKAEV